MQYIAFHNPEVRETSGHPVWNPAEHEVLSWCRLLEKFDVPCNPADLFFTAPGAYAAAGPLSRGARRTAVVHLGAGRPARHWPADRWAVVVRGLADRGYEVFASCAWHEFDRTRQIVDLAGAGTLVRFRDDEILRLANLLAEAAVLVSVDTGVPHLANALRTPSVVLFGPSAPARWGPLPSEAHLHACLWAGRTGDPDGMELDPGLAQITADQVLAEIDRFRHERII